MSSSDRDGNVCEAYGDDERLVSISQLRRLVSELLMLISTKKEL